MGMRQAKTEIKKSRKDRVKNKAFISKEKHGDY